MDWMIANPDGKLSDCAKHFRLSQSWLSCIIHSDLFQAKLRERQDAVFALVALDIPAKLSGLAHVALDKLTAHAERTEDPEFLLDAADKALHRLGYAPSKGPAVSVQQENTVVYSIDGQTLAKARERIGTTLKGLAEAPKPALGRGEADFAALEAAEPIEASEVSGG